MINQATTFPQTYQIQFSFHFDAAQRLLALARTLPDDVYRAKIGYSHESIHNTLAHLLGAAKFWREVITNTLPTGSDPFESVDMAGPETLALLLASERKSWAELLTTFDEVTLFGTFKCQFPGGPPLVLTIWQTLQHVILHGLQHCAELARMLTDAGHSPDDIDFLLYGNFPA